MVSEIKRYFNYIKKGLFRNRLNFLILYVGSKCNLSCKTCFFHKRLNKNDDLSFEEYEKISQSIGRFSILGIGGGEPFLRKDLTRICSVFIRNSKVDTLFIPTNGILTETIIKQTEILLKRFPKISISINPSLDGLAAYHDKNRGAIGTFDKAIKTTDRLCELKEKYPNLQVIVNSVIQRDNLEELKSLMIFLRQFNLDSHDFELIRDNPKNLPSISQIKEIHRLILENRRWYLHNWLDKIVVLGVLRYSQVFKELALEKRNWPYPCEAGKSIAVIYPNGEYAPCELSGCPCTHICFIHATIAAHPFSIFKIIYYYAKGE